ncbi:MAG: hypothetical protein MJ236_00850 [Clostridia bacterium]|nr:hypothetical protein [Clostridia bacterium]
MSVNIHNASTQSLKELAGRSTGVWSGTRAEYEAQKDNIADGTVVMITDDYDSEICSTVAECVASESADDIAGASAVAELSVNVPKIIYISGTTSSVGSLNLGLSTNDYLILGVRVVEGQGYGAFLMNISDLWYANIKTVSSMQNASSVALNVEVAYIERKKQM